MLAVLMSTPRVENMAIRLKLQSRAVAMISISWNIFLLPVLISTPKVENMVTLFKMQDRAVAMLAK